MNNKNYLGIVVCDRLLEASIPRDIELKQLANDPKVKEFIELSKKTLKKPDKQTSQKMKNLFDDPKIQSYLQASKKVGQRLGWIHGGAAGGALGWLGGAGTSALMGASIGAIAALGILGAVAGGLIVGYPVSKLYGILRRWNTEAKMTQGGLAGGTVVHM